MKQISHENVEEWYKQVWSYFDPKLAASRIAYKSKRWTKCLVNFPNYLQNVEGILDPRAFLAPAIEQWTKNRWLKM